MRAVGMVDAAPWAWRAGRAVRTPVPVLGHSVTQEEAIVLHRMRIVALAGLMIVLAIASPVAGAVPTDSSALRAAVTAEDMNEHLVAFQAIADAHNGTRASGTPGYDASVAYVVSELQDAGYEVTTQPFIFPYEEVLAAELEVLVPTGGDQLVFQEDFVVAFGSANATVPVAVVTAVDVLFHTNPDTTSTSGCEDADFDGFPEGNVALIQRGTCGFHDKVVNAQEAQASGVIIFNEGNTSDREEVIFPDVTGATEITIPVLGISFAQGQEFVEQSASEDGLTVRIAVDIFREDRLTSNVIAELAGRDDRAVVVGAHLDSVLEGPGINDNGSGSAMILEIALQMAALEIQPTNTVRFAFWGAEESGLLGAAHYVGGLSKREIKDTAINLNFDMVASPNFVRFVYDGDAGPNGSGVAEDVFLDYFASQGLATEPTPFDGRSDYGPFIAVGIPAGGLFTGAEGIKSAEEAVIYGGTPDLAYDPCYHAACDTIANPNLEVLDQLADAAAHATLTFAMTTSAVQGTDKGNAKGQSTDMEFRGHRNTR